MVDEAVNMPDLNEHLIKSNRLKQNINQNFTMLYKLLVVFKVFIRVDDD